MNQLEEIRHGSYETALAAEHKSHCGTDTGYWILTDTSSDERVNCALCLKILAAMRERPVERALDL